MALDRLGATGGGRGVEIAAEVVVEGCLGHGCRAREHLEQSEPKQVGTMVRRHGPLEDRLDEIRRLVDGGLAQRREQHVPMHRAFGQRGDPLRQLLDPCALGHGAAFGGRGRAREELFRRHRGFAGWLP
ncbi:MAG: hypothetical protein R3E53_13225 [Myxococcota bacterium]